jgi:hypothetical protein
MGLEGGMKVAIALMLFSASAQAAPVTCETGEYAQYKDKASTEQGLINMAHRYCMNALLAEFNETLSRTASRAAADSSGAADRCRSENSKIRDAADASDKGQQFREMTASQDACLATAKRSKQ